MSGKFRFFTVQLRTAKSAHGQLLQRIRAQATRASLAILCCLAGLAPTDSQAQEAATTWTSAKGAAIEAEFVRLTDDGVILKLKSDGREANVPFASLSLESHLQALKMGKPEAFNKPLVKAEIKVEPLAASNPVDIADLLRSPFTGDETIDQFIDKLSDENDRGNVFVLWHAFPPKMQDDLETLGVKAMGKVGSAPLLQIQTLLADVDYVLTQKKDFIFGYPAMAQVPQASQVEENWPLILSFTSKLAEESLWEPSNFEKGKMVPWLARLTGIFGQQSDRLRELAASMPEAPPVQSLKSMVTVNKQTATTAELTVSLPNAPPQDVKAIKVGKVWVVNEWMLELRKLVDEGLKNIDSMPSVAPQIQGAMALAIPVVGGLKNAKTQEEFNGAVGAIMAFIPGGMDMGGPPADGQSRPGSDGPGNLFDGN